MSRPDPLDAARAVVADRFPNARQAWLSGSVVLGGATDTSDLDITVLQDDSEPHRASFVALGWPVELFVHTESSIRDYVRRDLVRRRPTMARLVSSGVPLVHGSGGAEVRAECEVTVAAGPGPLPAAERDALRYYLTDQLDDLAGGGAGPAWDAVVIEVWRVTAELLLAAAESWSGTGKWLMRELGTVDARDGTDRATRLHLGLRVALDGDAEPLVVVAREALDRVGGPLWEGYRQAASPDRVSRS